MSMKVFLLFPVALSSHSFHMVLDWYETYTLFWSHVPASDGYGSTLQYSTFASFIMWFSATRPPSFFRSSKPVWASWIWHNKFPLPPGVYASCASFSPAPQSPLTSIFSSFEIDRPRIIIITFAITFTGAACKISMVEVPLFQFRKRILNAILLKVGNQTLSLHLNTFKKYSLLLTYSFQSDHVCLQFDFRYCYFCNSVISLSIFVCIRFLYSTRNLHVNPLH